MKNKQIEKKDLKLDVVQNDQKNGENRKDTEISSILGLSIEYLLTGEERQTTKAEEFYNHYLMQNEKIKSVIDILLS